MKTCILLAALLVLTVISAGFALNPQPEPPSPLRQMKPVDMIPPAFDQIKLPVLQNKFVISPVNALKLSIGNRPPTKVMSAKVQVPTANRLPSMMQTPPVMPPAGNPYATNKGVVLDVFNTVDKTTSSVMTVQNVIWGATLTNNLANHDPQTSLAVRTNQEGNTPLAEAFFFNLVPGFHTYMLTLGTTAKTDILRMRIAGQDIQANQMLANPNTNEVRVCFTYDTAQSGNFISVFTWLSYAKPLGYTSSEYFHHFQLAQLD
jgi:hypothetical protein